jgi:hypothetical protein
MVYGPTSYNRTVYAPGITALRGSVRLGRLRLPRLTAPTFLQALETYGFLYRACKNVIYRRTLYAICPKIGWNILYKNYTKKDLTKDGIHIITE